LSPEQVEKLAENLGKATTAADNFFNNLKGFVGPFGSPLAVAVLIVAIVAILKSTFMMILFVAIILAGSAPLIHKQVKELKAKVDERKKQKALEAQEEKKPE
jgi:hypothetical protein